MFLLDYAAVKKSRRKHGFKALYKHLKNYPSIQYMEHSERLELVVQQIDEIIDCFCIKPVIITSQAKAEKIIMQIIENHYNMMKKLLAEPKVRWIHSLKNEQLYWLDSCEYRRNIDQSDSLIKSLFELVDTKYDMPEKYERESYERFLCPVCANKYKMIYNFTQDDFCPQCKYRESQYKKDKENKKFSSVCLEHKIVMSYTYLWAYIMAFDLKTAHNYFVRLKEYRLFLNRVISILMYEKGRLIYGY